jgi:arylsulfatase A-like enzyme
MDKNTSRREFFASAAGALASLKAVAQTNARPNILFIIADDWGYNHAGVYGCDWIKTPNFDRIANEGVRFTNCFTSNPKCSPSRATILTGRNTWQLQEAIDHYSIFPKGLTVYPDLLQKAGYAIGMTGKGWAPGDFQSTGYPHNPAGPEFQKFKLKPPYTGVSPIDYVRNFEDFLSQKGKDQPFCFWLGCHEPHRGYEEGSGVRAGRSLASVKLPAYLPDRAPVRSDFLDYALEVEWFDRQLGRAIATLEQAGELDNTFILVTSDNGCPFPRIKGQIYEEDFHLPMAIRWGGHIAGGRVIDDFINFRDFAPTFMEVAGVKPAASMTGHSFLDVLKSGKSGIVDSTRSVMLVGKERHDLGRPNDAGYPVRAIRTLQYLYVRNYTPDAWPAGNPETGYRNVDDGPAKANVTSVFDEYFRMSFGKRPAEELYMIEKDPDCVQNLAADPNFAKIKSELQERMEKMLREEGDPRMLGNAAFFDTIKYTGPDAHSYENFLKHTTAK